MAMEPTLRPMRPHFNIETPPVPKNRDLSDPTLNILFGLFREWAHNNHYYFTDPFWIKKGDENNLLQPEELIRLFITAKADGL